MLEIRESSLFHVGEQHYHIMLGIGEYPSHNTVYDSFDEAVETFLALIDGYYPEFFEDESERQEVRENLLERAMYSTVEEQLAKVIVSIGEFKVGFSDCYGCVYPWSN